MTVWLCRNSTIIITFIINNNNRCGGSCYYSYFKQQLQVFFSKTKLYFLSRTKTTVALVLNKLAAAVYKFRSDDVNHAVTFSMSRRPTRRTLMSVSNSLMLQTIHNWRVINA